MRPASDEYAPYHEPYISLVPDGDIVAALTAQASVTVAMLAALQESMGDHRYAPGKWSIKEVVGHMIDTERIFVYRALRFARADQTPLAGYEQDDYVRNAGSGGRTLASLIEEFETLRRSTVLFFSTLPEAAWLRRGISNQKEVSVRAMAWIIAGHELHHQRGLKKDYLDVSAKTA